MSFPVLLLEEKTLYFLIKQTVFKESENLCVCVPSILFLISHGLPLDTEEGLPLHTHTHVRTHAHTQLSRKHSSLEQLSLHLHGLIN